MFDALEAVEIDAVPAVYSDASAEAVRDELLRCDGVLVWVDPVAGDDDRETLDDVLRQVADSGVWVSAHPDVILAMGTKEVLFRTRDLGWGSDVVLYRTSAEFRDQFPAQLGASTSPRVLKQYRGNGGIGVWKVERLSRSRVRVQGARRRGFETEDLDLDTFIARCDAYFEYAGGEGRLVDQPFQDRITEGIIRCYLVKGRVVGFCRQYADPAAPDPTRVFGLPAAKTMFPRDEPAFSVLRTAVESRWVPQMQEIVGVDAARLPFLWDADFLYGPRGTDGRDSYVLCEINVSSVIPYPAQAPQAVANALLDRLMTTDA
jgi:glutathione synthase/RimK-type ligase-like ATP-grasp enzyme